MEEFKKQCSGCGEIKSFQMFHKCKREPDGLQSRCNKCRSAAAHERYMRNGNKIRETQSKYRAENIEKEQKRRRKYKKENRDKIIAYEKANPEKVKTWKLKYIKNNREKHNEAVRKYQKENPDKIRDINKRRRKYIKKVKIEKFSSLEIFERDNWICQICKKPVDKNLKYPNSMSKSLDHIIPVAAGGSHERKNVQLAHLDCNKRDNSRGTRRRWSVG